MIIFLYGADTYRSRQKLNEIIDHYKKFHKSGLNLRYFDGEGLNFQDFKNEVKTISMFREKKLIILKDIFSNKDFQEEFLKEGEKFVNSDNLILIYEKKELAKKNSFFRFLKENSKSQEFKPLEGQNLKDWVKKELTKEKVKTSPAALEKLIEFVGNNLWQMSNEIKKLVNYKKNYRGPTPSISTKDIEFLVRPKIETDIFKTIDAIALKNRRRALELLHRHLEKGDNPLFLLSMINFQFRNLLLVRELIEKNQPYYSILTILRKTKLKPFVIKKSYQQAQRFSLSELKKIYQKIFKADLNIKTGKIEPEIALDLLIAEI